MKMIVTTAIFTFTLVAPTLAMPIASPVPAAHFDPAVVEVYYNQYRGGGNGHHYGWGRGPGGETAIVITGATERWRQASLPWPDRI
jgi:hypothetical protein